MYIYTSNLQKQSEKDSTYFSLSVKSRSTLEPEKEEEETSAALYIMIRHNDD